MSEILQKFRLICGRGGIGRHPALKMLCHRRAGSTPAGRTTVTSLTIKDLKEKIGSMAPIAIYIDCDLVWDDDQDSLEKYEEIFNQEVLVMGIYFKIVEFHHSEVYIYTC